MPKIQRQTPPPKADRETRYAAIIRLIYLWKENEGQWPSEDELYWQISSTSVFDAKNAVYTRELCHEDLGVLISKGYIQAFAEKSNERAALGYTYQGKNFRLKLSPSSIE
ncbi:MAG: hypothetical protein LBU32_32495 [Clostridiales bacterium]|nr:hypothetical protein [Clostridiales bacterium]